MRRRKPDSIEVQQMKQQAKEERMLRQIEQERLNREVNAREAAEAKQREYEEELARLRENMERKEREIGRAQEQIKDLELQLLELSRVRHPYLFTYSFSGQRRTPKQGTRTPRPQPSTPIRAFDV